mmetsp:Transcript_1605/g.2855  ORF Transcript_1605/g.2855 Transcript_1605/m.2855 type:complete len:258 (-) Transcript_1605:1188-1961(-)
MLAPLLPQCPLQPHRPPLVHLGAALLDDAVHVLPHLFACRQTVRERIHRALRLLPANVVDPNSSAKSLLAHGGAVDYVHGLLQGLVSGGIASDRADPGGHDIGQTRVVHGHLLLFEAVRNLKLPVVEGLRQRHSHPLPRLPHLVEHALDGELEAHLPVPVLPRQLLAPRRPPLLPQVVPVSELNDLGAQVAVRVAVAGVRAVVQEAVHHLQIAPGARPAEQAVPARSDDGEKLGYGQLLLAALAPPLSPAHSTLGVL